MAWLLRQEAPCGLYNIGTGRARSFRDLIAAVGAVCGVAPVIDYVETPPAIRPNYQYFTEANISKLRAAGYGAAFTPLEAAVRDFVEGYLAQSDPYL